MVSKLPSSDLTGLIKDHGDPAKVEVRYYLNR
jgi:hypothetical protein